MPVSCLSVCCCILAVLLALPASLRAQNSSAEATSLHTVTLPGGVPLPFVRVPAGSFRMGSPAGEMGRQADEGPVRQVRISRPFLLGQTEVTQQQWVALMGENPAVFQQPAVREREPGFAEPLEEDAMRRPVDSVSWEDAQRFVRRLNALGVGRFRLPSEAEWEYAARAGSETPYPWSGEGQGDRTHAHAWANSRSFGSSRQVALKPANAWGLFDMHGNVWEWCSDWYAAYPDGDATDPLGPRSGTEKVFRGGSWYDFPTALRSANRHRHTPESRYPAIGLRVLMEDDGGLERSVFLPGGVAMRFRQIPAGQFRMGSPETEAARQGDEGPVRTVTISKPYWLGVYEVTQAQWWAMMGNNPSVFQQGDEAPMRPVDRVSYDDALRFIEELKKLGQGTFRLPTEAEWEYAARAGTETRFAHGDDAEYRELLAYAWFNSRAEGRSHPVGEKGPNPWGLYDMFGNVWEWCADWYAPYPAGDATDPRGPDSGEMRLIRGGSWFNEPEALRSANRNRHVPNSRQTNNGIRLVWEPR